MNGGDDDLVGGGKDIGVITLASRNAPDGYSGVCQPVDVRAADLVLDAVEQQGALPIADDNAAGFEEPQHIAQLPPLVIGGLRLHGDYRRIIGVGIGVMSHDGLVVPVGRTSARVGPIDG